MAINKDKLSADIEARMDEFAQELTQALAKYFDWWLSEYPAQTLYGFCLYSTPLVEYLGATLFTEEGLTAVAEQYQNDHRFRHKSLTQLKQTLRWSACDSPHHNENEDIFEAINDKLQLLQEDAEALESEKTYDAYLKALYAILVRALNEVKAMRPLNPQAILFSVWFGDQSDTDINYFVQNCNNKEMVALFYQQWR
ncbi:hypothetical protein Shewmr4_1992 [Shewanella sp. MR-4]|uniref:DUF4303 domain-containing protein n=1 Tax=Shewanella sp. (strain MR-4) TaxID=60480 RepID=UPI00005E51F7|nr:DUF4303 domain-containing protein [Shewanella sp. MR-4]ABI39065.1 hypothetical protein Shewmr4_1992 [Shewanella sp. MR-4]